MERLTFEGNFCDIAQCSEVPGGSFCEDGACSQKKVWERLKAYEDTGVEPEEVTALGKLFDYALKESKTLTEQLTLLKHLRELAEADKDGRVVVLPCKVYETDGVRVYEHTVREVIYETAGGPAFDKNAIGKSIFLTRAEAENALQEMEGQEGWQRNEYVTAAGRR